MNKIGNRVMPNKLREIRIRSGIPLPRLADAAGLAARTISKVEGGRPVAPTTRVKILDAYNRLAKKIGLEAVTYEALYS